MLGHRTSPERFQGVAYRRHRRVTVVGYGQTALRRTQAQRRKLVPAPDGAPVPSPAPHIDSTLVKAIARAFRWRKMLETGQYATITEIAKAEKINPSYVSRVLRLTLLAPATVEAILDGQADAAPTLAEAMKMFPVEWQKQFQAVPA
jgi:hypothetical protein